MSEVDVDVDVVVVGDCDAAAAMMRLLKLLVCGAVGRRTCERLAGWGGILHGTSSQDQRRSGVSQSYSGRGRRRWHGSGQRAHAAGSLAACCNRSG